MVRRHAIDPRAERALAAKRLQRGHAPDQDLLRRILCFDRIAEHPRREVVDQVLHVADQRVERPAVTTASACDELFCAVIFSFEL